MFIHDVHFLTNQSFLFGEKLYVKLQVIKTEESPGPIQKKKGNSGENSEEEAKQTSGMRQTPNLRFSFFEKQFPGHPDPEMGQVPSDLDSISMLTQECPARMVRTQS